MQQGPNFKLPRNKSLTSVCHAMYHWLGPFDAAKNCLTESSYALIALYDILIMTYT